jgi:glycosyltransferase involved in cell wall biosynthesis
MKEKPLISVALCTYNGQRFLSKQLDSILSQSYTQTEIIIIDDCSTDNTRVILSTYLKKDNRITVIENEQNLGYTKNFEKALQLCKGEYIAISDQDDIWHPDKLKQQLEAMDAHQFIYHDSSLIDQEDQSMNYRISDKFNFYKGSSPLPFLYFNCVSGHTIMMRRSLVEHALPFQADFHYDQWLAFVATSVGTISYLPQPLVYYRQHQTNSTDLLSIRSKKKRSSRQEKLDKLIKEQRWLALCASFKKHPSVSPFIQKLYQSSLKKKNVLFNFHYFGLLWKNRDALFYLMKKKDTSKFFFALKNSWGVRTK